MSTPFGQAIASDHRAVYQLRDQYIASASSSEQQLSIALELMWNIARHTTMEQILVHPLCIKYLGENDGGKLSQFDDQEHQHVKESLVAILEMNESGMGPGTSEFDNLLEKSLGDLHRHNDSEEASDIPALEKHMSLDEASQMAQALEASKKFFTPDMFVKGTGYPPTPEVLRMALTTPLEEIAPKVKSFLGMA